MTREACSEYLKTVEASGLLYRLRGHPYVVGLDRDLVSGLLQCFVEYADVALLRTEATLEELHRALLDRFAAADVYLLPTPGSVELPAPWERSVTYVRYAGTAPKCDPPVQVRAATAEHTPRIVDWLERAIVDGYRAQDRPVNVGEARLAAERVAHDAGRVSYVAVVDDVPVGHVALLANAYDEVTGEPQVELVDLLVEPEGGPEGAGRALVHFATRYAAQAGLALVGNVVHPAATVDPARGYRVLSSLLDKDWCVDHILWRADRGSR